MASLNKSRLIAQVVLGQSDKESVGRLDTMASNMAQDAILCNTLGSRLTVGNSIASTTMQQAVIAPRSPRSQVATLNNQHTQATQSTVACRTDTRCATTNDDNIVLFLLCLCHKSLIYTLQTYQTAPLVSTSEPPKALGAKPKPKQHSPHD